MAKSTGAVSQPTAPDAGDGRERILDVAERLFAERGIVGVSLREINSSAGQRNASGVQYHFRNRAGLLLAIIERHMSDVDAERTRLLDELEAATDDPAPLAIMRVLVVPLAEQLQTSSGRAYLRIIQHLVDQPDPADGAHVAAEYNQSIRRVAGLMAPALDGLPLVLQAERRTQMTSFLLRALADRARTVDLQTTKRPPLRHESFVNNLVDVLVAVVTAPASAATLATLEALA